LFIAGEKDMCELCNPVTAEREKDKLRGQADTLVTLSNKLRQLANGEIKPHSPQAELIALKARACIRSLVEDWT
jgi:hypothetical protein